VIEEIAYAKLNLALHVRGKRSDGYHELDTWFAFAEDGDRLCGEKAEDFTLKVEGQFAGALAGEGDNLVLRAARALKERFGLKRGGALTLEKSLPVAAGLGGGSADAAAALRLLVRLWELEAGEDDLLAIASGLGADVPACVASVSCRGTGRGDVLVPAPGTGGSLVLLVNPGVPVPTAAVFARLEPKDRGPLPPDFRDGVNDLEVPAVAFAPEIGEVLRALRATPGVTLARMSGSGATCFALYGSAEDRDGAERRITEAHPGWWTLATRLR
jgi:4-diphosphocytidyl-2-C-methyl-D-erythritol kinase